VSAVAATSTAVAPPNKMILGTPDKMIADISDPLKFTLPGAFVMEHGESTVRCDRRHSEVEKIPHTT
jgi:hypothetical protein